MVTGDYGRQYDDYWSRPDRRGESSGDLEGVADRIAMHCGLGPVLDIGSGEGLLVATLVGRGIDARGLDVSAVVVERANARLPGRFSTGSVLALPYADGEFETVVSTDCLEHLRPEDVPAALAEMARVARRNLFLQIATTQDRDAHWHLTVEGRAWWESRCFEAGLRKHPRYYRLNPYESLAHDGWQVAILLEKAPATAAKHTLDSLQAERDLHMDMMRVTGERSDAHIVRYDWAAGYLKPGDRVLDAACGLGYGAHVLASLVERASVLGIDGSASAVAYASDCYGSDRVAFREGFLPQALEQLPEASFDAVVSFEALEHVDDPRALLAAFRRLLVPGGRLIVSVPHDWSDETGRDPNPFHLQVYDWDRLLAEVGQGFLLEERYAETASRAKVAARGAAWEARPRSLRPVGREAPWPDSEWCLLTAMKSPLDATVPYEERVFANVAGTAPVDMSGYRYPWLAHALINFTHRMRDPVALERLADEVMRACEPATHDYAAALCVKAYRVLERAAHDAGGVRAVLAAIAARPQRAGEGGLALRWRISLDFIRARLMQASGDLPGARAAFSRCGREDVRGFDIHLATKATEACFQAGRLALALGDAQGARGEWRAGVEQGRILLSVPLEAILLAAEAPNLFNHGDGVREYALAWDSIARCANGLHLLHAGGLVLPSALDASFQREYAVVTRDLVQARERLPELSGDLAASHRAHEAAVAENAVLRQQLEEVRAALVERDGHLRQALADLAGRDAHLRQALGDLAGRDEDLVRTRETLVRTDEALRARTRIAEQLEAELAALGREIEDRDARLRDLLAHPWRNLLRRSGGEPR